MTNRPEPQSQLIAHLAVRDAPKALEFYAEAFGAEEISRFVMPDGTVPHAELELGPNASITVGEASEEFQQRAPEPDGPVQVALSWYCPDVDDVFARAVKAGAVVVSEPAEQFSGDRMAVLRCPFGHRWIVTTHLRDVEMAEQQRAFHEMIGG